MKLKKILYLVMYSLWSLLTDLVNVFSAFKLAKTWSFILYVTVFFMAYYRKLTLTNSIILISLILIIYIIRQNKEGGFNKALREKTFRNNDEEQIREYYEKYVKQCFFAKKEPLSLKDYKKEELKKINEKKYTESDRSDTLQ